MSVVRIRAWTCARVENSTRIFMESLPTSVNASRSGCNDGESVCQQDSQTKHRCQLDVASNLAGMSLNQSRIEQQKALSCHDSPTNACSKRPVYDWQSTMKNLQERIAFTFNTNILADVCFLVGRGKVKIPAHKFILSTGSAVFDALFHSALATQSEEVEIPDVEPAAFLTLLKYLYTDVKDVGPDTVMTTLYAAKKYAVIPLEAHCMEFLQDNLRSDNAFMLLSQARLFDEPLLASMCLECIDKNTAEAIESESFTDIDHTSLCCILERDTLKICEAKLFQGVLKWAEAECQRKNLPSVPENLKSVMGRALSLIRFPLMTIEQFAVNAVQSGLLTDAEAVQMFLYYVIEPKPEVGFGTKPRSCFDGTELEVRRFLQSHSRWSYCGTTDRLRLVVDRRIFLVGFGLYGSAVGPAEYDVHLEVIHTATNKVCGSTSTKFSSDGSGDVFRVSFKVPVELQPNTSYIASAKLTGPDSFYGTRGLRKVVVNVPGSGKVVFQFSYAAGTNNNGTSVDDGQIPVIYFYM